MTTKRLISLTRYFTHAATDTTYKLNSINYPLLIAGTTDKARSFHPFATEDYEFIFKCIKDLAFEIYGFVFNLMLHYLLRAGSSWCFHDDKWQALNNQKINDMFQYFRDQWLTESNIGWHESYANGFPSTNNALEATNDVIKDNVIYCHYELSKFDTFPALDLNIKQNAKRGRRKKASSALQRNSTGLLNRDAFNMTTQLVSNSETNDSQPVINELTNQSAPKKHPRKNKNAFLSTDKMGIWFKSILSMCPCKKHSLVPKFIIINTN
ncbi:hypothetical protein BpHYR1_043970 [Brachionus plicatilis]|uniref:Uncharacterized protein n=1 Tax=Brachionus plicatilis TaxID=10195 RepID=A0A3M7S179_BRAPC|nr:hypothetical protein BpHYR1_043970 [Brachionus plicatilis]